MTIIDDLLTLAYQINVAHQINVAMGVLPEINKRSLGIFPKLVIINI